MKRGMVLAIALLGALGCRAQALRFDSLALRLPPLTEADTVRHTLTFRFTATSDASIESVAPECSCTEVLYAPTKIHAATRDSIVLRYTPRRTVGTVDELTHLGIKDEGLGISSSLVLHIVGEITQSADYRWSHLPAAMGQLRMKRKAVIFHSDDRILRIACANTGSEPLRITPANSLPWAELHTEPQVISPGEEADIVIAIDRTKPVPTMPVTILLDGPACPESERLITLSIQ